MSATPHDSIQKARPDRARNVIQAVARLAGSEVWKAVVVLGSPRLKSALVAAAGADLVVTQDDELAAGMTFLRAQDMIAAVRAEAVRQGLIDLGDA